MATLLIGGNGLVGGALIRHLCAQGEEVISYSSRRPQNEVAGCRYVQGDVTEYGTLNMVLKNNPIQRIIHNAAVSHPKLFLDNPYRIYRVNVTGTLTALEAARNYGVERFVYMSSGAVYGDAGRELVDESTPLRSQSPYGASKVAGEELVRNYGLDSVSLRIGFVYGPGRVLECPVRQLLEEIACQRRVAWPAGMDQLMDYIYIDDCVRAVAAVAFARKLAHREYNVGGGELVPFSRVVEKARRMYPDVPIEIGGGTLGYDSLGALRMERMLADHGYRPKVSIEEGMERYAAWLAASLHP